MKKESILLVVIALIVGLLIGILVTKGGRRGTTGSAPTTGAPVAVDHQQQISMLEELVGRDPGNRNAWVQLGNNYFDSEQPVKAVEAYGKALEIDPNDPNVLTDQGVMFRQLGWYDRAIDNFRKAQQVDPTHLPSLFNLGVVYRYDLQDLPKAKEAWSRYLEISPSGPGSDKIRSELESIRTNPAPQ